MDLVEKAMSKQKKKAPEFNPPGDSILGSMVTNKPKKKGGKVKRSPPPKQVDPKTWLNPMGENWEVEFVHHGDCMTCERTEFISKYNGTCIVCDGIMNPKEYNQMISNKLKISNKPKTKKTPVQKKKEPVKKRRLPAPKKNETQKLVEKSEEKTKEIKKTITLIPEEYPILALLWGTDGTSKSEQILKFIPQEGTIFLCLELGKVLMLAKKLNFPLENIIVCSKQNKYNRIDGVRTLMEIRKVIRRVQEEIRDGNPNEITSIALDGVTDIRPYAVAEWLSEHTDREKPNTPGDWREINDKVRAICFTLLNLGIGSNINIFFTSQVKHGEDGESPNVKEWILHVIHHKFKLTRDDINKKFYAYCEKSYYDPFFTLDLTDFTHSDKPSLLNILKDPELLKEQIKDFEEGQEDLVNKKMEGMF